MKHNPRFILFAIIFYAFFIGVSDSYSQTTCMTKEYNSYIKNCGKRAKSLNSKIEKTNKKYIRKYLKADNRAYKKLCLINPNLADHLFSYSRDPLFYHQKDPYKFIQNSKSRGSKEYYPEYDSLKLSLSYFNQKKQTGIDSSAIQESLIKANELDTNLQTSEKLQQYFRARKLSYKETCQNIPELKSNFKEFDKVNYYFHEQTASYKKLLSDVSGIDKHVMAFLKGNNEFGKIFKSESQLSVLDKIPSDWGQKINGLKTIDDVKSAINLDVKKLGDNPKGALENSMKPMQKAVGELKSGEFGKLSNAADIPSFKPSSLKTKSLADRINFGNNFQVTQGNYLYPSTVNLGLQISYQLSLKLQPGVGVSYLLGLGQGWDKISFTNRGFGLRSFIDYGISNLIFFEAGFEKNATIPLSNNKELGIKNWNWKNSALAGLKFKYSPTSKIIPTISLQYDFLADKNTPPSPNVIYRAGWEFGH